MFAPACLLLHSLGTYNLMHIVNFTSCQKQWLTLVLSIMVKKDILEWTGLLLFIKSHSYSVNIFLNTHYVLDIEF